MSLIQMQIAIDEHRADLEAHGIRGIDLDYLLDPRVEHRACLAAFESMVAKELARVLEIKAMCTKDQWAWFEAMNEDYRIEMKTLRRALKDLKDRFRDDVLKFYKEMLEAERRSSRGATLGDLKP